MFFFFAADDLFDSFHLFFFSENEMFTWPGCLCSKFSLNAEPDYVVFRVICLYRVDVVSLNIGPAREKANVRRRFAQKQC